MARKSEAERAARANHELRTLIYDTRMIPSRVRFFCSCGEKGDWAMSKHEALEGHDRHRDLALAEPKRAVQESIDRRG